MLLTETAFAKINLALHVRHRRDDGYHELETLFAFLDVGDRITARPAKEDSLQVLGEFARALDDPFDNLVMRALGAMPRSEGLAVTLEKNLPVAAGLGGGSADAGAIFRLVARHYGTREDIMERAAKLGADVPACVASIAQVGLGTGTQLRRANNDWEGMPFLLVNPRIPLATGPVFKAWDGKDRGPLPQGKVSDIARAGRNDLETPAIALVPEIGEVLATLGGTNPLLARMSGSGATCFAIFQTQEAVRGAMDRVARHHPSWWQMPGRLR